MIAFFRVVLARRASSGLRRACIPDRALDACENSAVHGLPALGPLDEHGEIVALFFYSSSDSIMSAVRSSAALLHSRAALSVWSSSTSAGPARA